MIIVPTFADGLAAYYGGRSKIFGVSGKDRSAVSMAGHAGKAFWFSTNTGDFVTSTYYYDTHVPIIFMGPGIQPKTVFRRVHPVDVAPTIAALMGMTPPGSAQGSPLEEVVQ